MGTTTCCSNRESTEEYSFSKKERKIIKALYQNLALESSSSNQITASQMKSIFFENKSFGEKLFKFFVKNKFHGSIPNETASISYSDFISNIELLIKEPTNSYLDYFKYFDKLEIMVMISLEKYEVRRDLLKKVSISYIEAITLGKDIVSLFVNDKYQMSPDETAVRCIVDALFHDDQAKTDWYSFITYIKKNLRNLDKMLKFYFSYKFLTLSNCYRLPNFAKPSQLLNNELLTLLFCNNPYFHITKSLQLVFSSSYSGLDLNILANELIKYTGPTLLLFKFCDRDSQKFYVFGAFQQSIWRNSVEYQGNEQTYLFSLFPKYNNFYGNPGGERNYSYLNLKEGKIGLGFGGNYNRSQFRIWIDENIKKESYVNKEDSTFQSGYLLDPVYNLQKLNICEIEAWGLYKDEPMNTNQILAKTDTIYLNELERLTTQIALNTQKLELGLEKGNPLHFSLIKSKKKKKKDVRGAASLHHNYIAGYSIKNEIFLSSSAPKQTTPKYQSENERRLEKSELISRSPQDQSQNQENHSFRRVETQDSNPTNRQNEAQYFNTQGMNRSNETKDSLIIYRYKQGNDVEIK